MKISKERLAELLKIKNESDVKQDWLKEWRYAQNKLKEAVDLFILNNGK